MSYIFIGIISDGEYKVTQCSRLMLRDPLEEGFSLFSFLKGYGADSLRANINKCKFIEAGDVSPEMREQYPTLQFATAALLIPAIHAYDGEIPFVNASDLVDNDDFDFDYLFIINLDTNKIKCCMCDTQYVWGEYDLDNLPDKKDYFKQFQEWDAKMQEELL